jgi:hypothetical protein
MASRAASRTLTGHEEIRQWAEERGATPACVRGTGGAKDTGMIRLDFPGYSGAQSLEPIEWDDWFQKFDESKLALLVQDETASGERSNFNKLIGRETGRARGQGDNRTSRRHPERSHRGTSRASTTSGSKRRSATASGARKKSSGSSRSSSSGSARTTASSSRSKRRSSSRSSGKSSSRGRGSKTSRSSKSSASTAARSGSRRSSARGTKASSTARGSQARSSSSARGARAASSRGRKRVTSSASRSRGASSKANNFLTDHDEIRRWAEDRDATPACVRGTGGGEDVGMIRLDFPGYSGADSLEHIEWDEWFQKFDERGLALLVQGETARGEKSNFNKLVSRETATGGSRGRAGRKSASGSRGGSSRKRAA